MPEPLPEGHPDRWLPEGFVAPPGEHVELGGVAEIAEEFGIGRSRVSMWSSRRESSGFPEPLAILAAGPVFDMAAVRAWYHAKYREISE